MRVWASGVRTGQLLFKTSGTEHLRCSRLRPCSSTDGCVFFGSQSHSPPGRRRCRGHRPYSPAALRPAFLGGSAPVPSASAEGGSWPVGKPPKKETTINNDDFSVSFRQHVTGDLTRQRT